MIECQLKFALWRKKIKDKRRLKGNEKIRLKNCGTSEN